MYKPCSFDRKVYLENADVFEAVELNYVDSEVCEFNGQHLDNIDEYKDVVFELAYTRYHLAKQEVNVKDWEESHEQIELYVKEQGEGLEAKDKQTATLQAKVQELELMQSGYDATIAGYEQREFKLQAKVQEFEESYNVLRIASDIVNDQRGELEATAKQESIFRNELKLTAMGWQDEPEENDHPCNCTELCGNQLLEFIVAHETTEETSEHECGGPQEACMKDGCEECGYKAREGGE